MRIYLDNCCYNRPFDDQSVIRIHIESLAKLYFQEMIRKGKIELVTSYVLNAENQSNPFRSKRQAIKKFMETYSHIYVSASNLEIVDEMACNIMKTGIKYMDACHVACAILGKADYFLTTDKRLLKYQTAAVQMMNPAELIGKMEIDYE